MINLDLVPDGGTVIDAGICRGDFRKDILIHRPNACIVGLEPNRKSFQEQKDECRAYNVALVGDEHPDTMPFNDFGDGPKGWGNLCGLYVERPHVTYDVETITIANLLAIISGPVHMLKMDIEGMEHSVVKSLTKEHAKKILQMSMEIHEGIQDLETDLQALGYYTFHSKETEELYVSHSA